MLPVSHGKSAPLFRNKHAIECLRSAVLVVNNAVNKAQDAKEQDISIPHDKHLGQHHSARPLEIPIVAAGSGRARHLRVSFVVAIGGKWMP